MNAMEHHLPRQCSISEAPLLSTVRLAAHIQGESRYFFAYTTIISALNSATPITGRDEPMKQHGLVLQPLDLPISSSHETYRRRATLHDQYVRVYYEESGLLL